MNIWKRLWLLTVGFVAACGGGGDGGSPKGPKGDASTAVGRFLYALNYDGAIDAYDINSATGALVSVPASSFNVHDQPSAAYANGSFLYVLKGGHYSSNSGTYGTNPTLSVLAINGTTGALSEIPGSPYTTGDFYPDYTLVFHPSNKFVYLVNDTRNQLSGYSISSANGQLAPTPGSPYSFSSNAPYYGGGAIFDSGGRYLCVVRQGAVDVFSADSTTGALSLVSSITYSGHSGTRPVLANDSFLYFVYSTLTGTSSVPEWLAAYSINAATGNLTAVSGSPYSLGEYSGPAVMHPSGGYIYLVNRGSYGSGSIMAFAVDKSTGQLAAVPNSPFATGGSAATDLVMSPGGKFLAVAHTSVGGSGGGISVFGVDVVTGRLTPAVPSALTVSGIGPEQIVFSPSGNTAYALKFSDSIYAFSIDATTGVMTPVNSYLTHAQRIVVAGSQ